MTRRRAPIKIEDCNMAKAMNVLGDKWKLLILREAFYGVRRFADIADDVGISPNILSNRLNDLETEDVLSKVPYKDDRQRTRYEYRLTDKGKDLALVIVALMQWGNAHLSEGKPPPLRLLRKGSGENVKAALVTGRGERVTHLRDIEIDFLTDSKE